MIGSIIPISDLFIGVLAFIRIGAILFALPIFGDQPTPVQLRILIALVLTVCLFPLISGIWTAPIPSGVVAWTLVIAKEILIGVMIGFVSKLLFDGMVMASALVGYQMGFGMANVLIPDAGTQMNAFTAFHRILVMLFFLILGLHKIFLKAIVDTFEMIPAGLVETNVGLGQLLITYTSAIFTTALQMSAPVLIALLFTMAALGLIARAVPQMNVFTLSFPISFFIGILVYIASLPFFPNWINEQFYQTYENIFGVIRGLSPL